MLVDVDVSESVRKHPGAGWCALSWSRVVARLADIEIVRIVSTRDINNTRIDLRKSAMTYNKVIDLAVPETKLVYYCHDVFLSCQLVFM